VGDGGDNRPAADRDDYVGHDATELAKPDPEAEAVRKLKLAKMLLEDKGKHNVARKRPEEIVKDHPGTRAAEEAKEILGKLPFDRIPLPGRNRRSRKLTSPL
jgi:hypothetical protein